MQQPIIFASHALDHNQDVLYGSMSFRAESIALKIYVPLHIVQ